MNLVNGVARHESLCVAPGYTGPAARSRIPIPQGILQVVSVPRSWHSQHFISVSNPRVLNVPHFIIYQYLPGLAVFLTQSLWLQFSDTFGRPVSGRREQRNYSATSDQGTGDEATLPRTEERPAKKKSGIRRSRSTTRGNQSSTPNVPTQPNKQQLFPGRKSSEKRGGVWRVRGGVQIVMGVGLVEKLSSARGQSET